jgi:hypothetical protein
MSVERKVRAVQAPDQVVPGDQADARRCSKSSRESRLLQRGRRPRTTTSCRAEAGEPAPTPISATANIQIHGGIRFTWSTARTSPQAGKGSEILLGDATYHGVLAAAPSISARRRGCPVRYRPEAMAFLVFLLGVLTDGVATQPSSCSPPSHGREVN